MDIKIERIDVMRKFASGLITGGILGAVGLTIAMSDRSTRKKIMKSGKRALNEAADMADDVRSKIW